MTTYQLNPILSINDIQTVLSKYPTVPLGAFLGLYDNETSLGNAVKTSGTGAMGLFQFEPATAARYGYPLTNKPTHAQALQQADAAAHYLSDLTAQFGGNTLPAFAAYNAGPNGINLPAAKAYANRALSVGGQIEQALVANPSSLPPVVGGAASAVSGAVSGVGNIADLLTSTSFWLRIGEAIAGIILLFLGLKSLTGVDVTGTAVKAAKAAAK